MSIDVIFSNLFQVLAAGGGGAVVAFGLFKFLGESWIENQLAKDLEIAKSEIALLAARKMKLHDREYVVFPEIWSRLNKAVSSLGGAIISFREFPDFSRMESEEIESWLANSDFSEDEKLYFRKQPDKSSAYGRILDWKSLLKAQRDFFEFHSYLQGNRIFLSPEIKDKLDQVDSLIHESWIAKKMDWDGHGPAAGKSFLSEALGKYEKEVKPVVLDIERLVQEKLFPETTL